MSTQYVYEPNTSGKVILTTTAGDIEVELWCKECPLACRNFIQLCSEGYYDGTIFHRVVRDFIIQGGDPTGTGDGGESSYGKPFKDEFHQRLSFNRRGLLGMANNGPDQNRSQFFITIGNEGLRGLTKKHTLFGQVVGKTVFNMLNIAECDVDEKDRPKRPHKIINTKVLKHPFDDIVVRNKTKDKKKDRDREREKKESKKTETKKLNLLSFGDEAEEDEEAIAQINKKLQKKGKSAHDVLNDEKLSTQVAVTKDEMTDYNPDQDDNRDAGTSLANVKDRFSKKRKYEDEDEKDVDLEVLMDEEKRRKEEEEMNTLKGELHKMQKEYIKALRPKEKEAEKEEVPQTEAMKTYQSLKLSFKKKGQELGIKKWKDPTRQSQTMDLLSKFTNKLKAADQQAILFDKKIVVPEPKKMEVEEEKNEDEGDNNAEKFGVDLDAEDTPGTEWMKHTFVAADIDPNVTKAKDANTKDQNEEWYPLNDPRNLLNKMRRGEE